MYLRSFLNFILLMCALLLLATPTQAGGWVVVTLSELPQEVYANQALRLGLMVRGHGQTPTHGFEPVLLAWNEETGEKVQAIVKPDEPEGHFTVEIVFPTAGIWQWESGPKPLGMKYEPLTVLDPPVLRHFDKLSASQAQEPLAGGLTTSFPLPGFLGGTGILFLLAAAFLAHKQRGYVALALFGVMMLLASLVSSPLATSNEEASSSSDAPVATVADAEYGKALFLAKGCATCHSHPSVTIKGGEYLTGILHQGSLSIYDDAYLRTWLRDPQAIRPDTFMPNLNLSEHEIEGLIAFLNSEKD